MKKMTIPELVEGMKSVLDRTVFFIEPDTGELRYGLVKHIFCTALKATAVFTIMSLGQQYNVVARFVFDGPSEALQGLKDRQERNLAAAMELLQHAPTDSASE